MILFFQAEDGIRDLVRSRGLGDVYKRQDNGLTRGEAKNKGTFPLMPNLSYSPWMLSTTAITCLLYTSDAADERSSVDLGGRRIIKKKKKIKNGAVCTVKQ